MSSIEVQVCQCPPCQVGEAHPDRRLHEQMNLLLSRLGRLNGGGMPPSRRTVWGMVGRCWCPRSPGWTRRRSDAARTKWPGRWLTRRSNGGSNSARSRVWKQQLQELLCDQHGLAVTVCHYPTGCSKWNPIEHRLFGPINSTWAGHPLATWETMLGYLRGTKTETGLTVRAALHERAYQTGEAVSDAKMAPLNLTCHDICPTWNSTLRPRSSPSPDSSCDSPSRELIL